MKDTVRIGYIGLGRRGMAVLKHNVAKMADVEIVTLCDTYEPCLREASDMLVGMGIPAPRLTADYREIVNDPTIDAVFLMMGWDGRSAIAEECLRAGKYTATEVGCAFSLEECERLLAAHKATGAPLMMLENICYARREMMLLRLALEGQFGEIVHCDGGYHHDLCTCELFKDFNPDHPHYRLNSYVERNCEQYPTHELGPIAKILGIGRGNRMVTLSSFASKSRGLKAAASRILGEDSPYAKKDYLQGDIVTTIITCANGETIHLCLDTTLPRPYYSRNLTVRGTRGMFTEDRRILYFEGMPEGLAENEEEMLEKYDHPLFAAYRRDGIEGGHGGADFLVCRAFIEAVKDGSDTPINTFDTLTWMAVAPLSELSIARGGAPVEFPDFTAGAWQDPTPRCTSRYSLDCVNNAQSAKISPIRK